jgi:hypothetical protein
MALITYDVTGQLVDAATHRPMSGFSVIAESGIRDESSPFCLYGIKRTNPMTDQDGRFNVLFFTNGTADAVESSPSVPESIEIHIEFSPGEWRCRVVAIKAEMIYSSRNSEACLDLGEIVVRYELCRLPTIEEDEE